VSNDQQARKERDKRSLQRATIAVGVASLGLAAVLAYAASAATSAGAKAAPISTPSPSAAPSRRSGDDSGDGLQPPGASLANPQPTVAPIAVTGGS
jgi:hypothetical protein